jgi:uncharacterized membrane protein
MMRLRYVHTIWNFLVVSTAGIGILILVMNFIPHQSMKSLADFLTPDGSLESFTPAIYISFKRIFLPFGLVSLLATFWMVRNRQRADQVFSKFLVSGQEFKASRSAEIRHLFISLKSVLEDSRLGIALVAITGVGIWNRALLLSRQVSHDEAYTYMAFASMGLRQVMTDYHLPNNHVFHSVLVFLSSELFGIQPWAIRLPALVAGLLLIPATYIVARIFYDKQTALISAAWVASMPALIGYAANARGYSLISLFSLLLVALGAYLKENKSLVGWMAFALIAALGFYTVPIMLYPFGIVLTWLFLAALVKQVGTDYGDSPFYNMVIKTVIPAGFAVIILVILLYTPIILNTGIQSVVGNGFVAPMEWWEFSESIPVRMINTWNEWNGGIPAVLTILLVIGLAGSVLSALARRPPRVLLAVAVILWIGTALVIQRVAPWPRVWIFLLPLVLIASAAGLTSIARFLGSRLPSGRFFSGAVFFTCLLVPLIMSGINTVNVSKESIGERGNIEELAIFLKQHMSSQDVILVSAPDAVILRYYLKQHGIEGDQVFYRDNVEYRNAWVIVNERYSQTLDTIMDNRSSTAEIDTQSAKIVYQIGRILVYELDLPQNTGN